MTQMTTNCHQWPSFAKIVFDSTWTPLQDPIKLILEIEQNQIKSKKPVQTFLNIQS